MIREETNTDWFENAPVYLDCNATTPVEKQVLEAVCHFLEFDFGNPGSRTHQYGTRAKKAVQAARDKVAAVVDAKRDEVVFTSGATESNNIAILGLRAHGEKTGRRHIVSTKIEHKAVLEPLERLSSQGFEVELLSPNSNGWIEPDDLRSALRADTLLVSVMHVNNETGVIQPLPRIVEILADHEAYLHVDASQGFGKELDALKSSRLDLISLSGHKLFAPKGIGALITRRRGFRRPPLEALQIGGGQEKGLRPGTLPVHQIVGLGEAAALALKDHSARRQKCLSFRARLLAALAPLEPYINGDPSQTVPHSLSLAFPGVDAEAAMVALKDLVAISNGSACTSHSYTPSHVLQAMGMSEQRISEALRFSWCHLTQEPDWEAVVDAIRRLR